MEFCLTSYCKKEIVICSAAKTPERTEICHLWEYWPLNMLVARNSHIHCVRKTRRFCTRWFKYDRDELCVNKSQFVPVIFEPPCISERLVHSDHLTNVLQQEDVRVLTGCRWFLLGRTVEPLWARHWNRVGVRDGTNGWGTAVQAGSLSFRFPMGSLEFSVDLILPTALQPWGRLSL
jgi:hypothetical protein